MGTGEQARAAGSSRSAACVAVCAGADGGAVLTTASPGAAGESGTRALGLTAEELRGAQVALSLAGMLVHDEPTPAFVAALAEPGCLDEAPFAAGNPAVRAGLAAMRAWLSERVGAADASVADLGDAGTEGAASSDASGAGASPAGAGSEAYARAACELGREWLRLLVGTGTPEAPSWESYYTQDDHRLFSPDTVLVKRLYERHGMQVEGAGTEPADHLGFLLQFVAWLAGREADLIEDVAGATLTLATLQADEREVLERHVLPWLPAWYEAMKRHARTDFYAGVADLVFGLAQEFARRFGIGYYRSDNAFRPVGVSAR